MMYWLLMSTQTWAASAHGDAHGDPAIPWLSIFVQAFNFTFLILLLIYFLRGAAKAHFANRASEYTALVQKAEAAKAAAERNRQTIQDRLNALERDGANTAAQAQVEANQLSARLQAEAKTLATKIEQEAVRSAQVESDKAKALLRSELLQKSLDSAKSKMSSLGSVDQKKLQAEFVEKIQVVGG